MPIHSQPTALVRGLVLVVASAGILLAGCAPSQKNRIDAGNRFDEVRARIEYDQAHQDFRSGDFVKAKQHLEHAIEMSGRDSDHWVLLGRVYLETNGLQDAVACFEKAARIDEGNSDARYFQGIASQRRQRPTEAVEHYLAALELAPGNANMLVAAIDVLIGAGRLDEASSILREHRADFDDHAAVLHLSGRLAMMEERWADAADDLEQSVILDDSDRWAMEDLARAQMGAGRTADCLATIDRILELPDVPSEDLELMRLRGRCLADGDRMREARLALLDLVNLHPEDVQGWIDFGLVCCRVEDFTRVVRSGQRLVVLAPERFEGYFLLGHAAMRNRDHESAAKLFARAVELAPDRDEPRIALGMTQEIRGEFAAAYRAYATVAERNPDDPMVRGLLSDVNEVFQD